MTNEKTVDYLIKLFGNKVGPIPDSVRYVISVQTKLDDTGLKHLLEKIYDFKDVSIEKRTQESVTLALPYATIRQKQQSGHSDGNGILNQILANHADSRTRIHIPIPDDIGITPSELVEYLSEKFGFMTEAETINDKLAVTISQFDTLNNVWQRHAEVDSRAANTARLLDERATNKPKGMAQTDEDDLLIDALEEQLSLREELEATKQKLEGDPASSNTHGDEKEDPKPSSATKETLKMSAAPSRDQFHFTGDNVETDENVIATIDTSGERPVVKPGPKAQEVGEHSKGIDGLDAPNVEQVDFVKKR